MTELDPFINFDMENFAYKIGGKSYELKEMSVSEFELLQAEDMKRVNASNDDKTTPEQELEIDRGWSEYVLKNCFKDDIDIDELKNSVSMPKYRKMIMEVPSFLFTIGDRDGMQAFTKALTESQKQ